MWIHWCSLINYILFVPGQLGLLTGPLVRPSSLFFYFINTLFGFSDFNIQPIQLLRSSSSHTSTIVIIIFSPIFVSSLSFTCSTEPIKYIFMLVCSTEDSTCRAKTSDVHEIDCSKKWVKAPLFHLLFLHQFFHLTSMFYTHHLSFSAFHITDRTA